MTASHDRLMELLTDRALVGLGQREQIELAELLVQVQDVDIAAFDRAAAAVALAAVGPTEAMPQSLASSIEQRALAVLDGASKRPASDFASTKQLDKLAPGLLHTQVDEIIVPEPASNDGGKDFTRTLMLDDRPAAPMHAMPPPNNPHLQPLPSAPFAGQAPARPPSYAQPPASYGAPQQSANVIPFARAKAPSRTVAISGWIAAAACLLLAIGAVAYRPAPAPVVVVPAPPASTMVSTAPSATPPPEQTPAALRETLLAAEGTTRAEWSPTKDPLGKATTGEVVWNKDRQKGVMRFKGLAKNDPSRAQYQLWIFDKTRDDKYPVDGGVFDVDSETGDVIVPIHATLPINAPVLFAVTLEKPGGVVVSKRDRLVVVAKLSAG